MVEFPRWGWSVFSGIVGGAGDICYSLRCLLMAFAGGDAAPKIFIEPNDESGTVALLPRSKQQREESLLRSSCGRVMCVPHIHRKRVASARCLFGGVDADEPQYPG
jgi:hypothetical protein